MTRTCGGKLLAALYALQIITESPREDDEHGLACSWAASHTALTWTTLSPEDQQEWLEAQPERLVGLLRAALRAYVEPTGVDLAGRAARLRAEWKGWHSRE